jgi:hypothetical protein
MTLIAALHPRALPSHRPNLVCNREASRVPNRYNAHRGPAASAKSGGIFDPLGPVSYLIQPIPGWRASAPPTLIVVSSWVHPSGASPTLAVSKDLHTHADAAADRTRATPAASRSDGVPGSRTTTTITVAEGTSSVSSSAVCPASCSNRRPANS